MKIKNKKNFFLATTSYDKIFINKKNNPFFLGYFCLTDKCNLSEYNSKNVLPDHWGSKKKILSKYAYLKKTTNYLFRLLVKKLNAIHNKNGTENYWRIIIYPWVCYYVTTLYDRWEIITQLKKKAKKNSFYTYEYEFKNNILEIADINEWLVKSHSEQFNNKLFNKIIKLRKVENIDILKKKIKFLSSFKNKKSLEKNNKSLNNISINFIYLMIDKLLSKIGIKFNKIFFDKLNYKNIYFLKLCFETFQVPSKNYDLFKTSNFVKSYEKNKRDKIKFDLNKKITFHSFLLNEVKNYLPISYLENYKIFLDNHKTILKKKRLFIGSYSIQFDDCFKTFLAESKSEGSKYILAEHGAGIHSSRDAIYDHFYNVSDRIIYPSKKIKKNKHTYIGLEILKKKREVKRKNISNKILVNFHEFSKFIFRIPVTNPPFSYEVKNFVKYLNGFGRLKNKIKKNLKFRVKGHHGLNCEKRFSQVFGKNSIENKKLINFTSSINESKLVICFIPQTSYIECIYNNIPTILVGNKESFFDTEKRLKILKKLQLNKMYFNDMENAADFINSNWSKIDIWWNNKSLQSFRKNFLKEYYDVSDTNYMNMKNLIKKELKFLK
tara:strand:- start:5029 stop:6849 length:1821 start_codon:yes stop_codon:yes gene_type:complete